MKAAYFYGPDQMGVEEVAEPTIRDDEMLIRIRAASICGTDMRIFRYGHFKIPEGQRRVLGHEIAGEIVQVGGWWTIIMPGRHHGCCCCRISDAATRSALEAAACRQAESIEKHSRLYPAVIDRAALQAARVEAALVRSQPRAARQDEAMSMFYIELNSTESG